MSNSSILGGDAAASRASGRDTDSLGPSDSSDTGSDVQGERMMPTGADNPDELGSMPVDLASDSDSSGTGERGAAAGDAAVDGGDILPDHIVGDESVDSDDAFDAGGSEGLDDIEDDADDDDLDDEGDGGDPSVEAGGAAGAGSAGEGSGGKGSGGKGSDDEAAGAGGRVFQVPAGTLDEPGEQR